MQKSKIPNPTLKCWPTDKSEQADSVLSQDFEVRGLARILRCEDVEALVEGGREWGTRHLLTEVKNEERQPSNYTCIGPVCETPA